MGNSRELCVLGNGRNEKAEDTSSARQSWAETQGISEQMASWILTVRNGQGIRVIEKYTIYLRTLGNHFNTHIQ